MKSFGNTTILFLLVLMESCAKPKKPNIEIATPKDGAVFNGGAVVKIIADIHDHDQLTSESLLVTKLNSDTVIYFHDNQVIDRTYHLEKTFITASNTKYRIIIEARGHEDLAADTLYISSN